MSRAALASTSPRETRARTTGARRPVSSSPVPKSLGFVMPVVAAVVGNRQQWLPLRLRIRKSHLHPQHEGRLTPPPPSSSAARDQRGAAPLRSLRIRDRSAVLGGGGWGGQCDRREERVVVEGAVLADLLFGEPVLREVVLVLGLVLALLLAFACRPWRAAPGSSRGRGRCTSRPSSPRTASSCGRSARRTRGSCRSRRSCQSSWNFWNSMIQALVHALEPALAHRFGLATRSRRRGRARR